MRESMTNASGRLKIFLGYAAGVGKTFRMLDEGAIAKNQGHDVVIGYFEPHGRKDTMAQAEKLEMIPRKKIEHHGKIFEEMDTGAVLARNPEICLVDELAHTNVPGSERKKRWENILILLNNGIHVWTTLNIQHLESLNDYIQELTNVKVRETVPDWLLENADEIVMTDLTTEALINRLKRGAVYAPEQARQALENFFKESTLGALREVAMRETAHHVGITQEAGKKKNSPKLPTKNFLESKQSGDQILVFITASPISAMLIRRARRAADFLQGNCTAVAISRTGELSALGPLQKAGIERQFKFAENLHIKTKIIAGRDEAEALINFAKENNITQIFLARPHYGFWDTIFSGRSFLAKIIQSAGSIRITVVAPRVEEK